MNRKLSIKITSFIFLVTLLVNLIVPYSSFARLSDLENNDAKILICTENGYELVSVEYFKKNNKNNNQKPKCTLCCDFSNSIDNSVLTQSSIFYKSIFETSKTTNTPQTSFIPNNFLNIKLGRSPPVIFL
jgi:hypothetical protein